MKRVLLLVFALMAASLIYGCSSRKSPVGPSEIPNQTTQSMHTTVTGFPAFTDDFESGVDPADWYWETINGAYWAHQTESGNGFVSCGAQNPLSYNDRDTDIHSTQAFDDFTFTWDWRFRSESWHANGRYAYIRSDGVSPYCHTYLLLVGVGTPTGTLPNSITLRQIYADGTWDYVMPDTEHPWSLNVWYRFKVEASGNDLKLKVWKRSDPEPEAWLGEFTDSTAPFLSGKIGFGNYWRGLTDVDNVSVTPLVREVAVDIKPGSCPNPFNAGIDGVLPVAVLASEDFDPSNIDPSSVTLAGVSPLRWSMEDLATPTSATEDCECAETGGDGSMDLALKFDRQAITDALGEVSDGDVRALTLSGSLFDGQTIGGEDCVEVILMRRAGEN